MRLFFWICLSLLIPGLLLRIPSDGTGILATDILVPIFAIVWVFKRVVVDRSFPKCRFILPGCIFLSIAILSFFLGAHDLLFKEQLLSAAYLVRFASLLIFGWAAVDLFSFFPKSGLPFPSLDLNFLKKIFWITGVVVFLGFLQFYLVPDISEWSTEGGWDPHTGRLLGTWMDPNFIAGFLGFMLPLIIASFYNESSKTKKFWLVILIVLGLGALFLTFSRSGYLASSIGLLFFFGFRDPKIILIGIVAVAIGIASNERAQQRMGELSGTVSALVFRDSDEIDPTASLRLQSLERSFELWKKYPLLGIGYNTYRYRAAEEGIVDEDYFSSGGSDSTHLTVLVTTGIIGFLAYLLFLGTLWLQPFLRFFRTKNELFLGFASGLIALFVHALFVNSLFFPLILLPVMAVSGVMELISKDKSSLSPDRRP